MTTSIHSVHHRESARQGSDDPIAKRFLKVMARSDLATESHNTNGLNALKNFVMDGWLYRPVFDPERQRTADRMPAVEGHAISSSITGFPGSARSRLAAISQHDERKDPRPGISISRAGWPAALPPATMRWTAN
jgi:hypothetical protein